MRISRREVIRGGVVVVGAVALSGTLEREASARAEGYPTVPPDNPSTLPACLPFLDWNPSERGTLLIVAPEKALLPSIEVVNLNGTQMSLTSPDATTNPIHAGRNGFRVATISPRFHRKLIAVGSISAVVPEDMAVLRYKNLPEPDLLQGVSMESRPQNPPRHAHARAVGTPDVARGHRDGRSKSRPAITIFGAISVRHEIDSSESWRDGFG